MMTEKTIAKLREIVGSQNLFNAPEDRIAYSYDGTPLLKQLPEAAVRPESVDQLSKILQLANEELFAVVPRGSGTGLSGGSLPVDNCIVVLTGQWNRIVEIDERNLTAWVEPGVITGDLHAAVERIGLLYPPDPGSSSICTIGGNVGENAGGLRGLKYGVTKDYILGLELVLPSGEFIRTGGKVVKDAAGYNLKDLMVGSEGTLGIFTRILVKLIPKPETSRTMLAYFNTMSAAAETVSEIISARITPSALEFLDNTTIRCVEDYARLGLPTDAAAMLLIEVDGRRLVVHDDATTVADLCRKQGAFQVQIASDDAEAMRLRAARKAALSALARVRPTTILEDVTVPRSEVAPMLEKINAISARYGLTMGNFGHAGDGNLHPTCLTDERDHKEVEKVEQAFGEIFAEAVNLGGTITGEHGTGLSKRQFLEKALGTVSVQAMRQVKLAFDPNFILNPGKVFTPRPRCEGPLPVRREQISKLFEAGAYS